MDNPLIRALRFAAVKQLAAVAKEERPDAGEYELHHELRFQVRGKAKQGDSGMAKAKAPVPELADVLCLLAVAMGAKALPAIRKAVRHAIQGKKLPKPAEKHRRPVEEALEAIQAAAAANLPHEPRNGQFNFTGLCDLVDVREIEVAEPVVIPPQAVPA